MALYVGLIFTLSAQPRLRPPLRFQNADKLCHILEYGGLGLLTVRALRSSTRAPVAASVVVGTLALCAAIGVADEWFQSFVPGRESSAFDALADAAGATLSQMLYLALARD